MNRSIKLCAPCCNNCPEVNVVGDEIVITDDNKPGLVREIRLTREQYKILLEKGKDVLI